MQVRSVFSFLLGQSLEVALSEVHVVWVWFVSFEASRIGSLVPSVAMGEVMWLLTGGTRRRSPDPWGHCSCKGVLVSWSEGSQGHVLKPLGLWVKEISCLCKVSLPWVAHGMMKYGQIHTESCLIRNCQAFLQSVGPVMQCRTLAPKCALVPYPCQHLVLSVCPLSHSCDCAIVTLCHFYLQLHADCCYRYWVSPLVHMSVLMKYFSGFLAQCLGYVLSSDWITNLPPVNNFSFLCLAVWHIWSWKREVPIDSPWFYLPNL